jgi:4-hydroxybenzoate polyprenyltransferase
VKIERFFRALRLIWWVFWVCLGALLMWCSALLPPPRDRLLPQWAVFGIGLFYVVAAGCAICEGFKVGTAATRSGS